MSPSAKSKADLIRLFSSSDHDLLKDRGITLGLILDAGESRLDKNLLRSAFVQGCYSALMQADQSEFPNLIHTQGKILAAATDIKLSSCKWAIECWAEVIQNRDRTSSQRQALAEKTLGAAPRNARATRIDRTILVEWWKPDNKAGVDPEAYRIYVDGDPESSVTVSPASRKITFTELTAGDSYSFVVEAQYESLRLRKSKPTNVIAFVEVPTRPSHLIVVRDGNNQVLRWCKPKDDGGSEITGYSIRLVGSAETMQVGANTREFELDPSITRRLQPGEKDHLEISAENTVGIGDWSNSVEFEMPAEAPGAPDKIRSSEIDGTVALTWVKPSNDGGSPVTSYTVVPVKNGLYTLQHLAKRVSEPEVEYGGLPPGNYRFTVSAENSAGQGKSGTSSSDIRLTYVPEPPNSISVNVGRKQAKLLWAAPSSDGGAKITQFKIRKEGSVVTGEIDGSSRSFVFKGLQRDQNHEVEIAAVNQIGQSDWSTPVSFSIPLLTPTPVTMLRCDTRSKKVTLNWNAPKDDGGSPIESYVVVPLKDQTVPLTDHEMSVDTTSAEFENLPAGDYRFSVVAENSVGKGATKTTDNPVSVAYPPSAPDGTRVSHIDRGAELTWSTPKYDGGMSIVGYKIWQDDQAEPLHLLAESARGFKVNKVDREEAIKLGVSAHNTEGSGPIAWTEPLIVVERPGVIPEIQLSQHEREVSVSWKRPRSDGGSEILGYEVQVLSANNKVIEIRRVSAMTHIATFSSLSLGHSYHFRVRATTKVGSGRHAKTKTLHYLATRPSKPRDSHVAAADRSVQLRWQPPKEFGGLPVRYHVIAEEDDSLNLNTSDTKITIEELQNGRQYLFLLEAINDKGSSGFEKIGPVVPVGPPSSPLNVQINMKGRSLAVRWDAPESDGGLPIEKYRVSLFCDQNPVTDETVIASPFSFPPRTLPWGQDTNAEVTAITDRFESPSGRSHLIPIISPPDPPTKVKAVRLPTSIVVSWDPPKFRGGDRALAYSVSCAQVSDFSWKTTQRSVSVTDLPRGKEYAFNVVAENKAGRSKSSHLTRILLLPKVVSIKQRIAKLRTGDISTVLEPKRSGWLGQTGPKSLAAGIFTDLVFVPKEGLFISDPKKRTIWRLAADVGVLSSIGDPSNLRVTNSTTKPLKYARDTRHYSLPAWLKLTTPKTLAVKESTQMFFASRWAFFQINWGTQDSPNSTLRGITDLDDYGYPSSRGWFRSSASLHITDLAVVANDFLILEFPNHRILKFTESGQWQVFAGTGKRGRSKDGRAANKSKLNRPTSIHVSSDGRTWIADTFNHRIVVVDLDGKLRTVAGQGKNWAYDDLGGMYAAVNLRFPMGVAVDHQGNLLVSDTRHDRILRMNNLEELEIIAGTGERGRGKNGEATASKISNPTRIRLDDEGNVFFLDSGNNRIRFVKRV